MGDRTYHCLTIVDCPDDQADAVLEVIKDHFGFDLDNEPGLRLGEAYEYEELYCGTSDLIAHDLIAKAPGASFRASEDPKYEWLGSVSWYTPDLGLFSHLSDANGQPVWTVSEILSLLNERGIALDDILHRALGVTHDAALSGLDDRNHGKIVETEHSAPTTPPPIPGEAP